MTTFGKTVFLAAIVTLPGMALAGGYGTAGVKDARVGNMASETATIWCPKLKTDIPIDLQRQMDCGDGIAVGSAKPAVAPARFGRGPFGLPPHVPSGGGSPFDDGDPTPTAGTPDSPDGPSDTPPDNNNQFTSKWDRLNSLGITQDNYSSQPPSTQSAVSDYFNNNGADGDWSGFNP